MTGTRDAKPGKEKQAWHTDPVTGKEYYGYKDPKKNERARRAASINAGRQHGGGHWWFR